MTHDVKIWPEFWDGVVSRRKEFELRVDDRPYAEGDGLRLHLWDPVKKIEVGPVARVAVRKPVRSVHGDV